jgi:hypothetical protein
MRTINKIAFVAALALLVSACEKEIEVKLPEVEDKIVVEGWIEQDGYAQVVLTRNSPYFEPVDSAILATLLVSDAVVTLSDGVNSEQLSLTIDPQVFPPFVYRGDSIKGVIGKRYTLYIKADGKTLSASTTIPQPVPYDSVWFQLDQGQDSLGFIYATVTDPAGVANYYRIFTKRLGRDNSFVPLLGSVYDDSFFDGITVDFAMARGTGAFGDDFEPDDEFRYFRLGDSVSIRSCAIDSEHHRFWRAIEKDIFTGGNPFVSPSSIPSNIEGGLGVWGGYGAQYVNMKLSIAK